VVAAPLAVAAGEMVPHGAEEHETVQVTPLFSESPVTLAMNCILLPACTVAVEGATETTMSAGGTMSVAWVPAPPPQPAIIAVIASPSSTPTEQAEHFTMPSSSPERHTGTKIDTLLRTGSSPPISTEL
jgi:hypothetical protein